jgi:hypothetical protein
VARRERGRFLVVRADPNKPAVLLEIVTSFEPS